MKRAYLIAVLTLLSPKLLWSQERNPPPQLKALGFNSEVDILNPFDSFFASKNKLTPSYGTYLPLSSHDDAGAKIIHLQNRGNRAVKLSIFDAKSETACRKLTIKPASIQKLLPCGTLFVWDSSLDQKRKMALAFGAIYEVYWDEGKGWNIRDVTTDRK